MFPCLSIQETATATIFGGTNLPIEVECEIEVVEVKKNILSQSPDGVLRHLGEDGVAELIETGSATPECGKRHWLLAKFTIADNKRYKKFWC